MSYLTHPILPLVNPTPSSINPITNLYQVHPQGVRHIRSGGYAPVEWKPPRHKTIDKASANERQVAISVGGGEIIYFELNEAGEK
jgi:splicing factor 3B subunit 3